MILTFGEIMLRLATPDRARFAQSLPGTLEATFGGGEANVAVSLARLGQPAAFMTALPDQAITDCLLEELRRHGVDLSRIVRTPRGRIGIYFLETGSNQRPSVVVYDREGSSVSLLGASDYDFPRALEGVTWVHTTGITPALSQAAFEATRALLQEAARRGIPTSIDLNFRKKLWRWDAARKPKQLAADCMSELLPLVNLVIANEEDAADVLGIHAEGASIDAGQLNPEAYVKVAAEVAARAPSIQRVAITLRESRSADHNNWGALLYDRATNRGHFAPLDAAGHYQPYEIRNIVDRVGGGDSFGAGLIHALHHPALSAPPEAIRFAVAASALKHTIRGDFNLVSEAEVLSLMKGSASGRVQR